MKQTGFLSVILLRVILLRVILLNAIALFLSSQPGALGQSRGITGTTGAAGRANAPKQQSLPKQSPLKEIVRILSFAELEQMMQPSRDTLKVINFWATWCKPCIEELPAFERLAKESRSQINGRPVSITLVSLDSKRDLAKRVIPFVRSKNLSAGVALLDAGNPNVWIDKVSTAWSGAIPATAFVPPLDTTNTTNAAKPVPNESSRILKEESFTYEQLLATIQPLLPKMVSKE